MIPLSSDDYLPFLKWKQGEYTALSGLSYRAERRVTPLFVLPPAGDYDPEEDRRLTPLEHIRSFGARLAKNRGKRPAFVDALHVDDDRHAKGLAAHPLTELLARASLAGAMASPITGIGRSEGYQRAVTRFLAANTNLPICIRLTQADLIASSMQERLSDLLRELEAYPHQLILVLDLGFYGGHEPEAFVNLLIQQINTLPFRDDWRCIALSVTSFPENLKNIKAGETKSFPRYDWALYQRIISEKVRLQRVPTFSDYGVEHPVFPKMPKRVSPTAQFRYSTDGHYLIVKGTSVRKPHGYEAIHPVAETLIEREEFMGASFSQGDWVIEEIAARRAKGGASCWRRASVIHHIETVCAGQTILFGTSGRDSVLPSEVAIQPPLL